VARQKDPTLKSASGVYKSTQEAIKRNDEKLKEKVDNIRIRVPKGWGDKMKEYVQNHPNYSSVNALVCDLIRKELNIDDDNVENSSEI